MRHGRIVPAGSKSSPKNHVKAEATGSISEGPRAAPGICGLGFEMNKAKRMIREFHRALKQFPAEVAESDVPAGDDQHEAEH